MEWATGYLENENFIKYYFNSGNLSNNTRKNLISVLGGGDTLAAINKSVDFLFLTYQQQEEHFWST